MKTLIKNGTIVAAIDIYKSYLLICGERIRLISEKLSLGADETIDVEGKCSNCILGRESSLSAATRTW